MSNSTKSSVMIHCFQHVKKNEAEERRKWSAWNRELCDCVPADLFSPEQSPQKAPAHQASDSSGRDQLWLSTWCARPVNPVLTWSGAIVPGRAYRLVLAHCQEPWTTEANTGTGGLLGKEKVAFSTHYQNTKRMPAIPKTSWSYFACVTHRCSRINMSICSGLYFT